MFLYMKLLNISIFVDVIGMVAACMWLYRLCCVVFGWSDRCLSCVVMHGLDARILTCVLSNK